MKALRLCLCVLTSLGIAMAARADDTIKVADLRCEYKVNPLGIETLKPRLTWQLSSDAQGAMQAAYQILVASTPENLAADKGDLWDTGKVESRDTALIPYAGTALAARSRGHWKVRVWAKGSAEPSACSCQPRVMLTVRSCSGVRPSGLATQKTLAAAGAWSMWWRPAVEKWLLSTGSACVLA